MDKQKGSFFGIGIGPGDPELLTVKAVRLLAESDVIYVPKARIKAESLARKIVAPYVSDENKFRELEFTMGKTAEELKIYYDHSAQMILKELEQGKKVVYLTLGDPMLYSTYIYLTQALKRKCPSMSIETVPGISSFGAAAALANVSLAEKNERIIILPVPEDLSDLKGILEEFNTVILLKIAKQLPGLIALLEEIDRLKDAVFISQVGLEGQRVIRDLKQLPQLEKEPGYLSLIIIKHPKSE
jgi:precorrin-2/cobalt-factor-2 C20-methyltransferase